ncbi:DUF2530 domain-containing protein [Agromyces agglutinans]|uniref:DUF2530 domain-containing protein n=1 Tax=Agromyces agglutinans TaxID=2662258 RepID=UPI0015629687|nr:DUF2530 domain-containing protein [Agromyces agglutinans]
MRFWLSEDERRPDPEPARADARKAVAVGTAAWLVAIGVAWWFRVESAEAGYGWLLPMAIIGFAIGVGGLVFVQLHRSRRAAAERRSAGQASSGR